MSAGCPIINDMDVIHSGHSKERNSKGIVGATEKGLRFQATHASQGRLLKQVLIKTIYTTCNYLQVTAQKDKFVNTWDSD